MGLCECGCGQETKPGNKFIYGHSVKKASKAFVEKYKGTSKSPDFCKKDSVAIKRKWQDPEYKEKMLIARKEQWTNEARNKMGISSTIRMNRPKEKIKNSNRMRLRFENEIFRLAHSLRTSENVSKGIVGNKRTKRGYYLTNENKIMYYASSYELRLMVVLDNSLLKWEKNWDRIIYRDMFGDKRIYTPDIKIFQDEDNYFYIEIKGYMDLIDFNKFNDILLYTNKVIYILFEKDIEKLEKLENSEYVDFAQFQTIDTYIEDNYIKFWGELH